TSPLYRDWFEYSGHMSTLLSNNEHFDETIICFFIPESASPKFVEAIDKDIGIFAALYDCEKLK
ncbi:hypothetical protein NAI73_10595, partial [Francisella tularensis subsp. holarctica]|uniref:hypothetical protein n=1 Tax=Francisella tularensis TaxID=263 RepID=UPI002381B65F